MAVKHNGNKIEIKNKWGILIFYYSPKYVDIEMILKPDGDSCRLDDIATQDLREAIELMRINIKEACAK